MVIGIIISLALLILIAYRGYSVILFAPLCALFAAITAGVPILPTYTELFMVKAMGFAKSYFPVFLLGAVFGKVMGDSGLAKDIADYILKKLGPKSCIVSVILACGILAYGGVSVFVVAFAVYPLGAAMFKEAGIPKRLLPGAMACGSWTFAMTALPGTPQIQNLIPTTYFGTDAFAAPIWGTVAGILMFAGGWWWLEYRKEKLMAAGENYGTMHEFINEPEDEALDREAGNFFLAILPLVAVLVCNFALTKYIKSWDPSYTANYGIKLGSVAAIWALIVAVLVGIILAVIIGWKGFKGEGGKVDIKKFQGALNGGAIGSLLAIMNTASEVGYGSVIQSLPGFKTVADFMMSIDPGTPLVSEAITVNVLAGITGSASGGMGIALAAMGDRYVEWAHETGVSMEMLHKVAALASGGFDAMPHNGAVITLLAITGMTHKSSYADIFATAVIWPFTVGFIVIVLGTLFGSF